MVKIRKLDCNPRQLRTRRTKPKGREARNLPSNSSLKSKRDQSQDGSLLPDEDSPFQAFICLDNSESTLPAPFAIMERVTGGSSGSGLNGADFTPHGCHDLPDLEGKVDKTPLGEVGSGKASEHLEGGKSVGRKDSGNSKERNDLDHTSELTETGEKRNDAEEPRYKVEAIIGFTVYDTTRVRLKVKWAGDPEPTLVDEYIFQEDCSTMLYDYWRSRGTREKATGIELFHTFRIHDWRVNDKLEFKLHWVGYPPEESTWELAQKVKGFAEEMHAEYLKTHPAAKRAWEKEELQRG